MKTNPFYPASAASESPIPRQSRFMHQRLRRRSCASWVLPLLPLLLLLTLLLTSLPLRGSILSGPIVNPANGHSYYLLNSNTWTASQAEAVALGGNLVTINDGAENDWVFDTFSAGQRNLWIGLYDPDFNGTYGWVDGTVFSYSNWDTGLGQPDRGNDHWVFIALGDLGHGLDRSQMARRWTTTQLPRSLGSARCLVS